MGRLLGLLEAGVVLGYWTSRKAEGVSETVRNGLPAWRLRRMLARLKEASSVKPSAQPLTRPNTYKGLPSRDSSSTRSGFARYGAGSVPLV
jgi:hypothetical protein